MLPGVPAPSNNPNAEFPCIHPDGRITFQVKAPQAKSVQLLTMNFMNDLNGYSGLGKGPYEMTKDADGFWNVTTPPIEPGLYDYSILIDGIRMADPGSSTTYGGHAQASCIEVPAKEPAFYDIQEIPHGEVRMHWYRSGITGKWRRAYVYIPPEYDHLPDRRYPVLYLQHAGLQNETSWVSGGRANFILDNLIAAGDAVPMIVVMENGTTFPPGMMRLPDPPPPGNPFELVLTTEVIPMIDATYHTLSDRDHRAMAGASGGSHQTLQITLAHLDLFSHIGAFSPAPMPEFDVNTYYGGVLANAQEFNRKVRLFFWGVGSGEQGIHDSVNVTLGKIGKVGVKYVYREWPGLSHEWQLWRSCLNDFTPRLFR